MNVSITAFIALLLSLGILANAFNNLFVNINILPTKRFNVGNVSLFIHEKFISRTRIYSLFEIATVSLCSIYWILIIIFNFKTLNLKLRRGEKINFILEKLWIRLLRPITIVTFITSIYTTVMAHDDIDLLKRDMRNFFTRIFNQLQNNDLTISTLILMNSFLYFLCHETELLS